MATNKRAGAGTTGPLRHAGGSGGGGRKRETRAVDPEVLAEISGRITALEEQKDPQRRSLFVDGEFVLGLNLETIARCGLRSGQAVDGPVLVRAWQMDLEKQAWDAALALLAAAPRTAREIGQRLTRRYPAPAVELVLERLERAGWLDDRAFAESYIRSKPGYGVRRLLADLIRKGVDREVASRAVQETLGEADAAGQARESAAKRLARMSGVDRETARRRLAGFLARRGFGPEAISRALTPLLKDLPPAERRQGKSAGWRREEADSSESGSSLRRTAPQDGSGLRRGVPSGGSSLRRTSSLQRRKPLGKQHEEE